MMSTRFLAFIFITLISVFTTAAELEKCLSRVAAREHRLEKQEAIRDCFTKSKEKISKENCFLNVSRNKNLFGSIQLYNENINLCFYDTSPFKNIKDCLNDTAHFAAAADHDEAVFYCYQMFQENLTQKECLETSTYMVFPFKKEYLKQHCLNF